MRSRICCVLREDHRGSHVSHTGRNWGGDHETFRLTDFDRQFLSTVGVSSHLSQEDANQASAVALTDGWLRFTASDGTRWRVHPDDAAEVLHRDPGAVFA